MGAWAKGPLENDTALDFMFLLEERPIVEIIDTGLASDDNNEIRAAAWLLKAIYRVYPIMLREVATKNAIERLTSILNQGEWISSWNDPDALVTLIRSEIEWFKANSS